MGQFTAFDMLLIVLLGNAVQNALLGKDTSMTGGLLLAATLIALNWIGGLRHRAQPNAPNACSKASRWCWRATAMSTATCCGASWSAATISPRRCARPAAATSAASHLALLETNGHITIMLREATASDEPDDDGERRASARQFGQPVARPQVVGQARLGAAGLRA